jgi:rhodanese-related sulfurtransferase
MSPRVLRGVWWMGLAALVPAGAAALWHPRRPDWSSVLAVAEVDPATVRRWPGGVLWIDARPGAMDHQEHIPDALHLPLEEWEERIDGVLDAWRREIPTVVYCAGGDCDASREVALRLKRDAQMDNVFVLKGGWTAWKNAQGE